MNWDYAAGFLDADGSLGFYKEYGARRVSISASQVTRPVLDQLYELIGHGKVYEREAGRSGNMNTSKALYLYRTTGVKILPTLKELLPRLIVKVDICQEMIEYIEWRNQQPYHLPKKTVWDRTKRGI